jgi:hypothetical protein
MDILVGADPELFVKQGTDFLPAVGLVPGTKEEPHLVHRGSVQVDGLALEVGINPAANIHEFNNNLEEVLGQLYDMLPKGVHMVDAATADFDPEVMKQLPAYAVALGCEPDFNAYTGEVNPPPPAPGAMRAAGGHIHVGWCEDRDITDPDHLNSCRRLARQMDCLLGVASVIEDPDVRRRDQYGKAGAFRPKPYGMEYRTLSNYWLFDKRMQAEIYRRTTRAFEMLVDQKHEYTQHLGEVKEMPAAQYCINNNNRELAWKLAGDCGVTVMEDAPYEG